MATFVRINDSAIQGYLVGSGEVKQEMDDVVKNAALFGARIAPKRSGRLAANFGYTFTKVTGPLVGSATMYNRMGYAEYVDEGTRDGIRATKARYLVIPKVRSAISGSAIMQAQRGSKGPRMYALRKTVRGQRGQFFMLRSLQDALKTQGLT